VLRNRVEKEESKLKGVDLVSDDLELGSFESLQNLIPTKIYSLEKKRGVGALSTTPITPTIPGTDIHPFLFYVPSAFGDTSIGHPFFRITGINPQGEIGHPFLFMGT
jgi:hypothetical protein